MIRHSKYGNKGYYPELKVIKNGVLAGFVAVHPKWAAFTEDDYYNIGAKVMDGIVNIPSHQSAYTVEKGSVDLSGYELVRRAFLSTYGQIEVTFFADHLVFNSAAVNKMPDVNKIELLVMPFKRLLAIRPAEEKSRYGMTWSKSSIGHIYTKVINGKAYLGTLYNLFGWRQGSQYKVAGTFQKNSEERFLLFDMQEAIRIVSVESASEDNDMDTKRKKVRKVKEYPEGWEDTFGEEYYSAQLKNNMLRSGLEQSGRHEDMIYNLGNEGVTSPEKAAEQMYKIIKDMVNGNI